MKKIIKKFIILFLFANLFLSPILYSENNVKCFIKFRSETIYFIGQPIVIKFEIYNNTKDDFFIELSDDEFYNFDFKIFSEKGDRVEYSKQYIIAKRNREKVFTRTILLNPGQSFSVEVDISQWFDFQKATTYYIQGIFYPSLTLNEPIITQNILKLDLNPELTTQKEEELQKEVVTREKKTIDLKGLPPYKVLELALQARQKRDWDTYFATFDYDKIMPTYNKYKTRYLYASEKDRLQLIEEFKKDMISQFYNDLVYFEIKKIVIEKDEATVEVYLEYKYKNYIEKFEGEYYLNLKNQIWLITGYTITPVHG